MKRIIIPSVRADELARLGEFRKFFREFELDVFGVGKKDNGKLGTITALIKESGMKVYSVHLRGFNLSQADEPTIQKLADFSSRLFTLFQPEVLVIHPGNGPADSLLGNIEKIMPRLPAQMAFAVENMTGDSSALHSPEIICDIVSRGEKVPQNFGFCIDTTHPNFEDFRSPAAYTDLVVRYMATAGPRLKHIHLSDRHEPTETHPGKHLPLGDGILDLAKIKESLSSLDYRGRVVIEVRGDEKDIIRSACEYYGVTPTVLKLDPKVVYMPGTGLIDKKIGKQEFLERLEKSWGKIPASVQKLLKIPDEGFLDAGQGNLYLFVPSPSYSADHGDPYYSITGGGENTRWAQYFFGIRNEGGKRLQAVLIDQDRKIAVAATILDIYDDVRTVDWARFEKFLRQSLQSVKSLKGGLDHIEASSFLPHFVFSGEEKSWG